MGPVQRYGDALAHVTVTRTATPPDAVSGSLAAATGRPVLAVHVDTGGAPAAPGATLLRLSEDVGRAAAVNRAVAGLAPDVGWVAIADPQVSWGAGALDVLLRAAAQHPRAGALGPRLRAPDGVLMGSGGPRPRLGQLVRGGVGCVPVPAGFVGWLAGTCVLVRRAAWDSVDGYDPRYAGSGTDPEPADVDLGDRLDRAGWLVVGVPSAEVTVHARERQGILETHDRGLRRYVRDRHAAPARALMAMVRRG
ncbi:dTDP-Rha--alpha-D-GlcNAc-pyrophosphate polyprenol alpha-3-L-rhamnosyltransferase [Pseudonocardia sp. GCM10023141]|uniref:dTDP-Rha--alpha-D-GlcNAc-pyrophosphate polyprenol alpha-3-L-rhamnosyltransferase n=1 Tax=Pseudonocardia sp. GCM10023141 TaxID=3252653 RepID=UPI00361EE6EC